MNLHVLRIICCSIGAISLISSMPALGSLASNSCNGIAGVDDPILSSCTNTNIYDVFGVPGITLSQTGTANADIKSGQLSATAIGDRYFSIGYAGTGSGLLRDDITVQGQGSNWSATIQMTMKIDGLVTGPLQNRPNIVAQAYLTGFPGDNSANINVSWDGTGFTTDTSTSVGNFSVNVIASDTNNYSVVLTNAFEVSEPSPTFKFTAYLNAIGGSTTTGTLVSDFGSTAQLDIILPAGYSFTSGSGVFLSAVPPPPHPASPPMSWLPLLLD